MTKIKKDVWEDIFDFPSFNLRFSSTLLAVLFLFGIGTYVVFTKYSIVDNTSEVLSLLNLIVQFATLVLGLFATYYALRQLVETRFNALEQSGVQEIERNHYFRAFEKWREAFYIKPDAVVFLNMCEALLLLGDYDKFDQYAALSQKPSFKRKRILTEPSEEIILSFLNASRSLLEENRGAAKNHIKRLILLAQEHKLIGLTWDFGDMQRSLSYQLLEGDCKIILSNIINYLTKSMSTDIRASFEEGQYDIKEPVEQTEQPTLPQL